MVRVALLWFGLMSLTAMPLLAAAQQPGDSVPTIRSQAELILVPVKVTRSHRHASGLEQSAFHVFDNGEERPIASFEEITRNQSLRQPATTPEKALTPWHTNRPQLVGAGDLTVVVFDVLNTSLRNTDFFFFHGAYLINARREFVHFMDAHPGLSGKTMVAVLGPGGLRVVHHYSSDLESLKHDLEKLPYRPRLQDQDEPPQFSARIPRNTDSEEAELFSAIASLHFGTGSGVMPLAPSQADPTAPSSQRLLKSLRAAAAASSAADRTATSFQQLANSLAAIPGRKTLIWITSGLPDMTFPSLMWVAERLERARQALAAANVAVYPISVNPHVENPVWTSPAEPTSSVRMHQPFRPLAAGAELLGFAEKTGGQVCTDATHMDRCFKKALDDSAEYYQLSYYVAAPRKPGWHEIRVKVDGPRGRVRARQGYMQPKPTQDLPLDQINLALASPLDFTAIPLSLRCPPAGASSGEPVNGAKDGESSRDAATAVGATSATTRSVTCEILLDPRSLTMIASESNHMKFDLILLLLQEDSGRRAATVAQTINLYPRPASLEKMLVDGILCKNSLSLPPGKYSARAVVRDWFDGRIGTLTVPLNIH